MISVDLVVLGAGLTIGYFERCPEKDLRGHGDRKLLEVNAALATLSDARAFSYSPSSDSPLSVEEITLTEARGRADTVR
jgi:hypothetical protein